MIIFTALICSVITYGMSLYHLTLIFGAPFGEAVFGGKHKVLPAKLRFISLIFLVLFAIIGTFYLIKVDLINLPIQDLIITTVLIVYTVFLAYAIIFNFKFSKSKKEKFVMGPITVAGFLSSLTFLLTAFLLENSINNTPLASEIIISILIVIIILIISMFIGYLMELSKLKPIKSGEIVDGIFAIKAKYTNPYAMKSGEKYILIDTGYKNSILPELEKLKINPDDVTTIFLTHTDFDHTGSIDLFKNASIYISEQEEQMLNVTTKRAPFGIMKNRLNVPYQLLKDGQELNVGDKRIKCILTEGHTKGSMSFIVDDIYLFTGDNLSLKNGHVEPFNDFFNMNTKQQKISISKISNLPDIKYIFTAHYGYSDNYKIAFENWND